METDITGKNIAFHVGMLWPASLVLDYLEVSHALKTIVDTIEE